MILLHSFHARLPVQNHNVPPKGNLPKNFFPFWKIRHFVLFSRFKTAFPSPQNKKQSYSHLKKKGDFVLKVLCDRTLLNLFFSFKMR